MTKAINFNKMYFGPLQWCDTNNYYYRLNKICHQKQKYIKNHVIISMLVLYCCLSSMEASAESKLFTRNTNNNHHHSPLLSDYLDGGEAAGDASSSQPAGSPGAAGVDTSDYNYFKEPYFGANANHGDKSAAKPRGHHQATNNHDNEQGELDASQDFNKEHASGGDELLMSNVDDHATTQGDDHAGAPTSEGIYETDSVDEELALQPEKEFLTSSLAEKTCQLDRGCQRKDRLNNTYLSYCARHRLEWLLSTDVIDDIMHGSSETCERVLDEYIRLDEQINKFHESFKKLLQRYNCHNGYSVKWTCNDCKRAYKDWLCTTNLPFYMNGERVKPCISFCERVEQRCPYLHPITKEQYGGQPAFICKDPNIPFVHEITPNTLHSKAGKCYDLCHLSSDKRELQVDSLSTYEGYCPSKNSIAEQVRHEEVYCQSGPITTATTTTMVNETGDNSDQLQSDLSSNSNNNNNIGNKLIPCDYHQASLPHQSVAAHQHHSTIDDTHQHHQTISMNHLAPDEDTNNNNSSHNAISNPNSLNIQYPLHCEKLNELSLVFESYKSQPKGQTFSHHDR